MEQDCMRDYREAVLKFTVTLGEAVMSSSDSTQADGETMNHSATNRVYRDLLLLMVIFSFLFFICLFL